MNGNAVHEMIRLDRSIQIYASHRRVILRLDPKEDPINVKPLHHHHYRYYSLAKLMKYLCYTLPCPKLACIKVSTQPSLETGLVRKSSLTGLDQLEDTCLVADSQREPVCNRQLCVDDLRYMPWVGEGGLRKAQVDMDGLAVLRVHAS